MEAKPARFGENLFPTWGMLGSLQWPYRQELISGGKKALLDFFLCDKTTCFRLNYYFLLLMI